jgi:hypothetical protein
MHHDHSDHGFRVLHTLRCIGTSSAERVASAAGLAPADTATELRRLEQAGLVTLPAGPFSGWEVTEPGRVALGEMLSEEMSQDGVSELVTRSYERFLALNPSLLQIGTDWQIRQIGTTQVINDHTDDEYDAGVLDRLMRVDESLQPILDELTENLPRFDPYRSRLTDALERVMGGYHGFVSDSFDSYHTVWFQLHEDLLVTLGITREEERSETRPAAG